MAGAPAVSDHKDDWNFDNIQANLFTTRQPSHMLLDNIQGLVARVCFPTSDNALDVLYIAGCGLCDDLTLMELRSIMLNM